MVVISLELSVPWNFRDFIGDFFSIAICEFDRFALKLNSPQYMSQEW